MTSIIGLLTHLRWSYVLLGALIGQATAGVMAWQPQDHPPRPLFVAGMDSGEIVILITTILGFAIALYRESRNRKWDLADRQAEREALAQETRAMADRLAIETRETADRLSHEIAVNTDVSIGAFKEANDVNRKIWGIARRFMKDEETSTIEDIDKTTKEINEKVTDLTDALTPRDDDAAG